jgi:HD-GYP domain-containing protein (c-di-GMP phosphodiesterase class II)
MFIEIRAIPRFDRAHNLIGLIHVVRDISERKNTEEQIKRQLERMTALRSIDMAISSTLDLRVTLHILLEQVVTQLKADAADILLLDQHTMFLNFSAGRGFKTKAVEKTHIRLGQGFAGRAAMQHKTISILDLADGGEVLTSALKDEGFCAYFAVPLIAKGQVKGILEVFHRTPLEPDNEWISFLEILGGQAAIAVDNVTLFDTLQRSHTELIMAYDTTLEGWSRALDYRDRETEGHSQRVTDMTVRIARAYGMNEDECVHVRRGALLHDIGKLGVPDSILLKPGKLTEEEWLIMKRHPVIAFELLSPIAFLRPALDIPYCHHEKWDGTGYPRGLRGEQISLAARIFALVDVWDALRSDRPYRPAWSEEKVMAHIKSLSGSHFDPAVVEMFLKSK